MIWEKKRTCIHLLVLCVLWLIAGNNSLYAQNVGVTKSGVIPVVSGIVVDEKDEPVIGVAVRVVGTQYGVVTDIDGKYSLSGVAVDATIEFSYLGMKTKEIKAANKSNLNHVILESDTEVLEEVVVVGYGVQKKVNVTGAVTSVNIGELENRPVTNVTNALAGLSSGLMVSNTGGNTPGFESSTIKIRGNGTLNDASPLIVVDGMTGISMSDINPQDIATISVLKDASSSAIYGSRAANGVILITTKSGSKERSRITYSANLAWEKVAHRFDLITDYATYMETANAALTAAGQAARFSQESIDKWRGDDGRHPDVYPNNDWQDYIYNNNNLVQNHNITAVGGNDKIRYNLSMGLINNPGIIYNTDYRRYQMRSNIEADIKPWITVGMNMFGFVDRNDPSADTATSGGDVIYGSGAFNTTPGMTYKTDIDGVTYYGGVQNPEDANFTNFNPYRRMWFYNSDFPTRTRRAVAKTYLRLRPIAGLTISGSFSYNLGDQKITNELVDRNLYRFMEGDNGKTVPVLLREGTVNTYKRFFENESTYRTSDVTAQYDFKFFNDRLNTSVLAGFSQEAYHYNYAYYGAYTSNDQIHILGSNSDNVKQALLPRETYNDWAMRSYLGRINMAWDDKYLLEFTMRADGSSKFSPENRWGYFPSVSLGWRMSEEAFMENTHDWLSGLKIRLSYGSLGNNATSTYYMWQSLYTTHTGMVLGGSPIVGTGQSVLSNYNMTWEKTKMLNMGIDFGFLNNKLSGTIEVYDKNTEGILISLPVPFAHGTTTTPNSNVGEVNNKGFDFDIKWSDRIGEVDYYIGGNVSYVKNKVTKLYGETASISGVYKTQEGKPINQLYVLDVDRIVRNQNDLDYVQSLVDANPDYFNTYHRPELGDYLYRDANGDGKLDANDRIEIGNSNMPTWSYGISMGASWKNFDFGILFQGVGDYHRYLNNQAFRFVYVAGHSLVNSVVSEQWTPDNQQAKYPRLLGNADMRNQQASTGFVHDASYFRCKNIQLGYTIPKNISQKFLCESLKVYGSIDNLFTLTRYPGMDPEVSEAVGYPAIKQFSLGVNISF